MTYSVPGADGVLDQGDLIDNCFILSIREIALDGIGAPPPGHRGGCDVGPSWFSLRGPPIQD